MLRKLTTVVLMLVAANVYGHGNLKLVNGLWYDGTKFAPKTMYSVENVFRDTFDGEARLVDLGGRYVVPPLADAHNHVLAEGNVDEQIARYLRAGIFYVKNPNNSAKRSATESLEYRNTVFVCHANEQVENAVSGGVSNGDRIRNIASRTIGGVAERP